MIYIYIYIYISCIYLKDPNTMGIFGLFLILEDAGFIPSTAQGRLELEWGEPEGSWLSTHLCAQRLQDPLYTEYIYIYICIYIYIYI